MPKAIVLLGVFLYLLHLKIWDLKALVFIAFKKVKI